MTDNMQNEIRGEDISRPVDHLEIGGVDYPLAFDMHSLRVAEDVYDMYYGRIMGFARIVKCLAAGSIGAVMAVLYGALVSGAKAHEKDPMTWTEFADKFTLVSIPGVKDLLLKNLQKALPKVEAGEGAGNPQ